MGLSRSRKIVDLNAAPPEELRKLPVVGTELAAEITRRRPFKSWEAFKQAFGFDQDLVHLWRQHGAIIGLTVAQPLPTTLQGTQQKPHRRASARQRIRELHP